MSEMVERVARAIKDAEQMHWNDMARAAIEAMREPTAKMVVIADSSLRPISPRIWRAMIDEALK